MLNLNIWLLGKKEKQKKVSIRSEEVHKLHRSHSVISLLAKEAFVSPGRNGVLDITISHLKHGMGWESLLIIYAGHYFSVSTDERALLELLLSLRLMELVEIEIESKRGGFVTLYSFGYQFPSQSIWIVIFVNFC